MTTCHPEPHRRRRTPGIIALLFLTLPLFAAEPWVDAYNRGVAAVNSSNYKLATSELQKAIAEMPNEGTQVKTRAAFITYVPHFWLGIAKYNLGDIDGALREWRISEEQGAIGKTEYYATMKNWVSRAQAEKKRLAQGAASGAKKNAADAIAAAVLAQSDALSADRTDQYRQASRLLEDANAKYNRGGTDIAAYNEAAQMATRATSLFNAAAEEAKKQRAARQNVPKPAPPKPQQQKPPEFVVPFPGNEQPKPEPQTPKPEPQVKTEEPPPAPVITKAKEEAETAVQRYRRNLSTAKSNPKLTSYVRTVTGDAETLRKRLNAAKADPEYQAITQIANDLDAALAKQIADAKSGGQAILPVQPVQPPVAPPPAAPDLRDAYRAYASGDLASAEQQLTSILDARPNGEAYLLRGCARYTRAMLSRKPDALLREAAADFKAALQQNSALRLDSRAFSPKLIAWFEDVRNGR